MLVGEPPATLGRLIESGRLGRKSGRGFYRWKQGRAQKRRRTRPPAAEVEERLVLALLNTCVACLREGVVADAELADAGLVFGTGFAPFRGGPLHYLKQESKSA